MATELVTQAPDSAPATNQELLAAFGDEYLSIQSLFSFCFVPGGRLNLLKDLTVEEEWGSNNFVLLKYLAVHVRLGIEQGRYVWNGEQLVMTAGWLCTAMGSPLYLGLVRNSTPDENPWVMNWIGERPSCAELPEPPDVGQWPELDPSSEVVLAFDMESEDRRVRIPGLEDCGPIAQTCGLVGAVVWAIHRGLAVRQIHGGGRGYFVPVYLNSREDLTSAPDAVAPILIQGRRLVVRTLLDAHVAYSPARAVVERWEQLPAWLLDAWDMATVADPAGRVEPGDEPDDDHPAEDHVGEAEAS